MNCDTSNCSYPGESQRLNGPAFASLCLLMTMLAVAVFALSMLTIVALCMARSMAKHLRIFLINILVTVLVMGGALLILSALSVIRVFADPGLPPLPFCRVIAWLYGVGGYARPLSVSAYSVVVLASVRFGKKGWKTLYSAMAIAMLWITVLIMNIVLLVPAISVVQYFEGVVCFADTNASNTEILSVFSGIRIIFGNMIPLAICIVIPVYCLHYIRKNTVIRDTAYKKAIARLALFLVTGNAINAAAGVLTVICAYFSATFVSVCILIMFGVLSLLSTPIFIIMFLKVVQDQLKAIITCHCSHSSAIHPLKQP